MSNITLHKATEEVRELLDQVDPETGQLPDGFEQARAVVATKSLAVTAYITDSERQAEYLQTYAKEIDARARAMRRRADWLRQYLMSHMAAVGVTKVGDGIFTATLAIGRDKSVDVFDADQLPSDYLREIPARVEPDKALIRKSIDDGFEVPGARLVARDRLTIK